MQAGDLAHWRLRNLRLEGEPLGSPEAVVGWLGAVQSQDYAPAKWSVAARARGVSDAAMDQAFAAGSILRTHVLRPTWHFVLPADIRWLLALTGPRVESLMAARHRQLGLDARTLERCTDLLVAALQGGHWLTRPQLGALVRQAGVATDDNRLAHILMHAELNGVIVSGGLRGKQHTYALLEERVPAAAKTLSRDEALAELVVRYFSSHGPAVVQDLRWWSSLTVADIRRGLDLAGSRLRHQSIDGAVYWFAEPAPCSRPASPVVHLLQAYDEYIVGYAAGVARSQFRRRPLFSQVIVLDGQVAGHWRRRLAPDRLVVEAALYVPFDADQTRALEAAVARHARFLGLSPELRTQVV